MVTLAQLVRGGGLALLGGVAFALACNPIFGITSASVDPALDQAPGDDGGAGGADAAAYTCAAYCETIARNCTGLRLEYNSVDTCLAFCKHFDLGNPGDQTGDSLACRVYHASAAASDPDFHCPHAGPTGGTHCGDLCDSFCLLDFVICGDRHPYASEAQCRQICPAYPYINRADAGDLSFEDGPSLNCRLWHLESAIVDPVTHCPHTSLSNVHCSIPPDAGLEASLPP
jgi:hypothetical protein